MCLEWEGPQRRLVRFMPCGWVQLQPLHALPTRTQAACPRLVRFMPCGWVPACPRLVRPLACTIARWPLLMACMPCMYVGWGASVCLAVLGLGCHPCHSSRAGP
jgi:hypothetical protein